MVLRHLLFWLLLTITLYFFIVLVFPLEIPQIMAVLNPPSLSTWRDVENISESTPRTRRHISGIPPNERRCYCHLSLRTQARTDSGRLIILDKRRPGSLREPVLLALRKVRLRSLCISTEFEVSELEWIRDSGRIN